MTDERTMTAFRQAWARLVSFFRKQELDHDFNDELASHIELATEEHIRQGRTPAEAHRQALVDLGGIEPFKEAHRDTRGLPWLDGIVQDIRFAFRSLRQSPGFTLTAVATLAVGIGVNSAVFTVANGELFKGFPAVVDNDRVVYVSTTLGCCVSYPEFLDWRSQTETLMDMGAAADLRISLGDGTGLPEVYAASQVTANTFELIGQTPTMGRDFAASDEGPGAPTVTILSHSLWQRRYAADPTIVGQNIRINDAPTTVIGVMGEGVAFPQNEDLWLPLTPTATLHNRDDRGLWFSFGRMNQGATVESVRAEMATISARLAEAYPETNRDVVARVQTFSEFFLGGGAEYAMMLLAVGFVLLIACANLANLMLGRAIGRAREMSVRLALGAGRWRIARQLLIESVVLSGLGGLVGWLIANGSVHVYELAGSQPQWRVVDYSMDWRVLAYLIAVSVGTGILFGLAPVSTLFKLDINSALKSGGRGAVGGRSSKHLSSLLVVGEMALAVVLLAGAGVMVRSFMNVYDFDLGVESENVLVALLSLPVGNYPDAASNTSFFDQLSVQLEAIPGVESVAIAEQVPTWYPNRLAYELEDSSPVDRQGKKRVATLGVSPGYFRTLKTGAPSGRSFNEADGAIGLPTVIVNRRFAQQHWPGENALGKRLRLTGDETVNSWRTVVGVASNVVQNDPAEQEFIPVIYLPFQERLPKPMWIIVQSTVHPTTLAGDVGRAVHAVDSTVPIWLGPYPLSQRIVEGYRERKFNGVLFSILGFISLLLASFGLYAVMSHAVSQRTREIGVRIAIGGSASHVRAFVFRQGMLPLATGLVIGLVASVAVNRALEASLVGVSPADPIALVAACTVLILSAMLGCLIPARRATRVNPVDALRGE